MKKTSNIFIIGIMIICVLFSSVNVFAEENISDTDTIDESVFNTIQEGKEYIDYSELTIANLPRGLIESTGIDISKIDSLDSVDAQNLYSFTTVNNDGTKTLYAFIEPIKYIDRSSNKVCFINEQTTIGNSTINDSLKQGSTYSLNASGSSNLVTIIEDSYASNASTGDHSAELAINVSNTDTNKSMGYVKFDVSEFSYIKPELVISATYNMTVTSGAGTRVNLYDSNSNYYIPSLTYSSLSSNSGTLQSYCESGSTYSFSITELFKKWLLYSIGETGGKYWRYGIILRTPDTSSISFASSESGASRPSITVTYTEDDSFVNGIYYIKNVSTGKYLDATSDQNVVVYPYHGADNQKWRVEYQGDGLYKLYTMWNYLDGLMLDAETQYDPSNADMYHDNVNGQWVHFRIVENEDGTYRIMTTWGQKDRGLSADLTQASQATTNAQFAQYTGASNQKWEFIDATPRTETKGITSGNIYTITNVLSSMNMDVYDNGTAANTAVIQFSVHGRANQNYRIEYMGSGEYKISPVYAEDKVLSLNTSKRLIISEDNNTNVSRKRWYIIKQGNSYYLVNKEYKGEFLSVNGSTNLRGYIYSSTNKSGGKWSLNGGHKYVLFVNNYYDYGFTTRYGFTESTAQSKINSFTDAVAARYLEIFDLKLFRNYTAEYYKSPIDECKGTVSTSNIDTLCSHAAHTQAINVAATFRNSRTNRNYVTISNVFWTGHAFGCEYNDVSISTSDMIMMSGQQRSDAQQKGTLMHELNHQIGVKDHYHKGDVRPCNNIYCSECGEDGVKRPESCVMSLGRNANINATDVICSGCKDDIMAHLEQHH